MFLSLIFYARRLFYYCAVETPFGASPLLPLAAIGGGVLGLGDPDGSLRETDRGGQPWTGRLYKRRYFLTL